MSGWYRPGQLGSLLEGCAADWRKFAGLRLCHKLLLIVVLIFGIWPWISARSLHQQVNSLTQDNQKLGTEIGDLRFENERLHRDNLHLQETYDPLRRAVIETYPKLELTAAIAQLLRDMEDVKQRVSKSTYRELPSELKAVTKRNLSNIPGRETLIIEVYWERGDSQRQRERIAKEIADIMTTAGIQTSVVSGLSDDFPPIHVRACLKDVLVAETLVESLSAILKPKPQVTAPNDPVLIARGCPIELGLYGTPSFPPDGSFTFE
jgi:hypothetical protein